MPCTGSVTQAACSSASKWKAAADRMGPGWPRAHSRPGSTSRSEKAWRAVKAAPHARGRKGPPNFNGDIGTAVVGHATGDYPPNRLFRRLAAQGPWRRRSRKIAVHVIAHFVLPRQPCFQHNQDRNDHGSEHQRTNPIGHTDQVSEEKSGPALAEEGLIDCGFGVNKGHRSTQTAKEGKQCVAIAGADLCQRGAGTGARK